MPNVILTIAMAEENSSFSSSNVEFYLLLIALKLGFISATKIFKSVIAAYKWHKNSLKKKYSMPDVEANIRH